MVINNIYRSILLITIALTVGLNSGAVYAQPSSTPSATVVKSTPTPTLILPSSAPVTGINLTVSPAFINLATDPGQSVSSQIKIQNNGVETEYLQIRLNKFTTDNGDTPVLADPLATDEFIKWLSLSENQFTIRPNESKTIKFTISPPRTAALGYYYALVIDRIKDRDSKEAGGSALSGAPAISVLLDVRSPNAKQELQLVDFKTDHVIYEYLPVTFQIIVKNTGNIHIVPTGDIFIDQGNTKDIAILHANVSHGNILPQTRRTYESTWDDGFLVTMPKKHEDGTFIINSRGERATHTVWDLSKADKFRIGKYTANLLLVYDNGERDVPVEAQISFWILPWKIMAAVFIVCILVLLGLKNILAGVIHKFAALGGRKRT